MNKLKAALVGSYAGAILIALVSSSGIASLVQWLFALITVLIERKRDNDLPTEAFPAMSIFSIVHSLILFAVAFLLLRWLYFPTEVEITEEAAEPTPED